MKILIAVWIVGTIVNAFIYRNISMDIHNKMTMSTKLMCLLGAIFWWMWIPLNIFYFRKDCWKKRK